MRRSPRGSLLQLCAAGLALLAAPAGSRGGDRSPAEALAVARRVQARYEQTADLAAEFSQEMRLAAGGQVIRSHGRMFFAKPGRMRWEYQAPEPQTIVADGETLWVYQPEDRQVLRAPLRRAFQSDTPVSFLLGVARLERDFEPSLLDGAPAGVLRLRLEPRAEEGSLGTLVLEVDAETYDIRAATIRDPLGNTTRVALRQVRRNAGVDPALFRFERPPGVDVIQAPAS